MDQSRGWDVKKFIDDIWEVFSVPTVVVDLKDKTCTCRKWQLNGLPYVHSSSYNLAKVK